MGDADAIKLVALLRDRQGRRTIESKVYMLRMGQAASGAPTFPRVCQQLTPAICAAQQQYKGIYIQVSHQSGYMLWWNFFYIEH